jgi:type I restriction enzyme S subunit
MNGWTVAPLHKVAQIERKIVDASEIAAGTTYVGLENILPSGDFEDVRQVACGEIASSKFKFSERHVLYGKLRPYLSKIARSSFSGVCSTDILPILPGPKLDRAFLFHYLRQPSMVEKANSLASGANLPRLSPSILAEFAIPLPPLAEQRRIAAILDHAEALRVKRREALGRASSLIWSLFLAKFGDPVTNAMEWPTIGLGNILEIPLRNGLSPSSTGSVNAKVLTLSAITGSEFKESAWKEAPFQSSPPSDQRVKSSDLLICRGNGNLSLVGKGYFPPRDMLEFTFPDTMIAARVATSRTVPLFLQVVWNGPSVRKQIEALARTTNGTFKVNQGMLENIALLDPPLPLQQEFARQVAAIDRLKASHQASLAKLDELFASLQHRAFRGELTGAGMERAEAELAGASV